MERCTQDLTITVLAEVMKMNELINEIQVFCCDSRIHLSQYEPIHGSDDIDPTKDEHEQDHFVFWCPQCDQTIRLVMTSKCGKPLIECNHQAEFYVRPRETSPQK
jgi:hypothetical protein